MATVGVIKVVRWLGTQFNEIMYDITAAHLVFLHEDYEYI